MTDTVCFGKSSLVVDWYFDQTGSIDLRNHSYEVKGLFHVWAIAIGLLDLVKKTNSNQLERQTAGRAGEDYLEEICVWFVCWVMFRAKSCRAAALCLVDWFGILKPSRKSSHTHTHTLNPHTHTRTHMHAHIVVSFHPTFQRLLKTFSKRVCEELVAKLYIYSLNQYDNTFPPSADLTPATVPFFISRWLFFVLFPGYSGFTCCQ